MSNNDIFLNESPEKEKPKKSEEKILTTRSIPKIIEDVVDRGIKVYLTKNGYEIEGFYKAGNIKIEIKNNVLHALDKKEKATVINSFDDLVRLNYDWWKRSRDKSTEFINPGKEWLDDFNRLNLVKRQVLFIPGDD